MESGFEARAQRASSTSDERRGEYEDWTKVSGGLVKVKRQASSKRPESQRLRIARSCAAAAAAADAARPGTVAAVRRLRTIHEKSMHC